jgi:hypothetical protein
MSNDPIQTQTPGENGPTVTDTLAKILNGKVADIAVGLDDLNDADLAALLELEGKGSDRKGVHTAIELEQKRRAREAGDGLENGEVIEGNSREPDATSDYRHLSAKQIDASKLQSAVLSHDGWVVPNPSAKPLG